MDFDDLYYRDDKLGSGAFGEVYRVRRKSDNKVFAAKETILSELTELDILTRLEHLHIVRAIDFFIGKYQSSTKLAEQKLIIILPLATNDLYEYPLASLDVTNRVRITYEIASAVNFLANNRILHLDLKLSNILIFPDLSIKIADFGISCYQQANNYCIVNNEVFTGYYKPLEEYYNLMIENGSIIPVFIPKDDTRKISLSSIIWTLGIIFYEILSGKAFEVLFNPDKNIPYNEIRNKVYNTIIFNLSTLLSHLPNDESKQLISKMLIFERDDRITLSDLFNQPLFINYNYQVPIAGMVNQSISRPLVLQELSLMKMMALSVSSRISTEIFFLAVDIFYRTGVGFDPRLRFIACIHIASYVVRDYYSVEDYFSYLTQRKLLMDIILMDIINDIINDINGVIYPDNYYTIAFSLLSLSRTLEYLLSYNSYFIFPLDEVRQQITDLESVEERNTRQDKYQTMKEFVKLLPANLKVEYEKEMLMMY